VDQLVITLAGCLCAFSDLEKELEGLNPSPDTGSLLGLWDSSKWASKDKDLSRILRSLQNHKLTLTLMLTVINWYVTTVSQQIRTNWYMLSANPRSNHSVLRKN
jgi:hypothetical protein